MLACPSVARTLTHGLLWAARVVRRAEGEGPAGHRHWVRQLPVSFLPAALVALVSPSDGPAVLSSGCILGGLPLMFIFSF